MTDAAAHTAPIPSVATRLALGLGSGLAAGIVGAGIGRVVAELSTVLGYGYSSFASVSVRVLLALVVVGAAAAAASLGRLPLVIGAGATAGAPLGLLFGALSWTGFGTVLALSAFAGALGVALDMTQIPALMRREYNTYFFTPIAYVVATVFLGLSGFVFWFVLSQRGDIEATLSPMLGFTCQMVLPFLAPVLTMRLFAEEMRTGTMEVLMTAPVRDWEVVIAKFAAALSTFAVMVSPTLVHVASLYLVSERGPASAPLVGGYIGLLFTAALFIALGMLASSLTRDQIVAAILGFAMSFGFIIMPVARRLEWVADRERVKRLVDFISYDTHFSTFFQGIIDTRSIVYFTSLVVFVLFLTVRIVESRKWR